MKTYKIKPFVWRKWGESDEHWTLESHGGLYELKVARPGVVHVIDWLDQWNEQTYHHRGDIDGAKRAAWEMWVSHLEDWLEEVEP